MDWDDDLMMGYYLLADDRHKEPKANNTPNNDDGCFGCSCLFCITIVASVILAIIIAVCFI